MDNIYTIKDNFGSNNTEWINFQMWALDQHKGLHRSDSKWDQHTNALILNKILKKFKGCLIFSDKIKYNSYVVTGIRFKSSEDLLHFKLKFN